jgi:hypothetical protein
LLDRILDRLRAQRAKALPYKDVLRQVKDILLVSTHQIEEVFFKLQELGLVNCHKDGLTSRSFVFIQTDGFLAACERHHLQYSDHLDAAADHDESLDLADLPGFDPDRLLQLGAKGQAPQGLFRVSRKALSHWAQHAPHVAREARTETPDEAPAPAEI